MLPGDVAAHMLGISARCLKEICRRLCLARWPHRKLATLASQYRRVQADVVLPQRSVDEACALIKEAMRRAFIAPDTYDGQQ